MDDLKLQLFKAQEAERKAAEEARQKKEELEAIKDKIRDKPQLAAEVSEHALMQFLKRALNYDVNKVITEMLNLCDMAGEYEEQNRSDGMQYVYETDGPNNTNIKFIVKTNKIVTCFITPKEAK